MGKLPTIRDVAKAAGVSVGSASRVVNGASNVRPELRVRVEGVIARLGFEPNAAAQSIRRGVTRTIGVLVRDISVPALAQFIRAVEADLGDDGYAILLASSGDRRSREIDLLRLFARRKVDGLIMTTCDESDSELVAARALVNAPIVLLDRVSTGAEDCVTVDHARGVSQGVRALTAMGHRRIAIVTGSSRVHPGRDRLRGYREGLEAARIAFDQGLVRESGFDADGGWRAASALLDQPQRPTALIAGSSSMLPGVMRAIAARGLRIATDISLIAGGGSDLAELTTPSISVVDWSYADLGRAAANQLRHRLAGDAAIGGHRMVASTELIMRSSCAPPPA